MGVAVGFYLGLKKKKYENFNNHNECGGGHVRIEPRGPRGRHAES
jgi:hypothetical protein